MSKKEIQMWDITMSFRVRKEGSTADTKKAVKESAQRMIANADIPIEDVMILIK